jgi:Spy/CpxP family protein refolding chaperone
MKPKVGPLVMIAALAGCAATGEHAGHSPYAGQQSRDIKALSEDEARGYAEGAGMGFAKAAELNGYPGPAHVLENAQALGLTPEQRKAIEFVMQAHKAEARALGAELLRRERELDALFATRQATAAAIDTKTFEIGLTQAKLRASHLKAHTATTALLTPEQVDRYNRSRGYASH